VCGQDHGHAQMTCDGQNAVPLPRKSHLSVRRHADQVRLLHPKGHNHYEILRAKLGWGGLTPVSLTC
jgi:NAD+ kinase